MVLLTDIIRETSESFGLGNKAGALIAEAIKIMFDSQKGGLKGFLDRFEREGLGELTKSWMDGQANIKALDGHQFESIVSLGLISAVGKNLGLANARVRAAMAYAIPPLVRYFTSAGFIPAAIPGNVQAFLESEEAKIIAPASTLLDRKDNRRSGNFLGWTLGVVVLIVTAGLTGYQILKSPMKENPGIDLVAETPATAQNQSPTEPESGKPEAKLAIRNDDGHFEFSGLVGDAGIKAAITEQMVTFYGPSRLSGNLNIDPLIGPPAWLSRLDRVLPQLNVPGLDLRLEGHSVRLGGWLSERDRESVLNSLRKALGAGYRYAYLGEEEMELSRDALTNTLAALGNLPLNYSGQDLVNALNQWVVPFPKGESTFPDEAREVIRRAAEVIKFMPQPAVIEIGGHTDNQGNSAENLKLSRERAESVRSTLIQAGVPESLLVTKSYGGQQPIASNDTPYGRFKNRRIEFKVAQVCDLAHPCNLPVSEPRGFGTGAIGVPPVLPGNDPEKSLEPLNVDQQAMETKPSGKGTARKPKPKPKVKPKPLRSDKVDEVDSSGEKLKPGVAKGGRWIPQINKPSTNERGTGDKKMDKTDTHKSGVSSKSTEPRKSTEVKPKPKPTERKSTTPSSPLDLF